MKPIKEMIEQHPSVGYQTVVYPIAFNKNIMRLIVQRKGWQVRKRPVGMRVRPEPRCLRFGQPAVVHPGGRGGGFSQRFEGSVA